jgi:hypothetical protein
MAGPVPAMGRAGGGVRLGYLARSFGWDVDFLWIWLLAAWVERASQTS